MRNEILIKNQTLTTILMPLFNNLIVITFYSFVYFLVFVIVLLVLYKMETKLNCNKAVFNKLNDYLKDN
jgi:cellulose synthase/poly-beta-1,6-N-acetylglucosamine synthase-like glycosyltransferase